MPTTVHGTSDAPIYRLSKYDRVTLSGVLYRPDRRDTNGYVFRREDDFNTSEAFTHEEIDDLLQSTRLTIDRNYYRSTAATVRNLYGNTQLCDLPMDEQREILWRQEYCDRFLRMESRKCGVTRSDVSMKRAIQKIAQEVTAIEISRQKKGGRGGTAVIVLLPPQPTQFREWLKRYEAAGYNPVSLRNFYRNSGNRKSRLDGHSSALAMAFARHYQSSSRPTKVMVFREYERALENENDARSENGQPPLKGISRRSFEKLIDRLDPFFTLAAREGMDAAKAKFGIVNDGLDVTRPLERVELDEWRIDLQTLLVKCGVWELFTPEEQESLTSSRAWLTAAIDAASRCILALRLLLEAPSSASAISAIEMIVSDKQPLASAADTQVPWEMQGSFETLVMDSGAGFIANETKAVISDLGAEALYPPSGLKEMRARIERVFGTFAQNFVRHFPGQTFENVVAKGDYDAQGNACINTSELNRTLLRYVIDVYHNSPHEGLAGETPRNAWLRLTAKYGVLPPPDKAKLRHIFGIHCERRIENRGIRILGLHYQSRELQELRRTVGQKPVAVRVNRHDLGEISVRTENGWMAVKFQRRGMDMAGISIWEWMTAAQSLRRQNAEFAKVNVDVVRKALDSIRGTVDMAIERAELASPIITPEAMARLDHQLFKAFNFVEAASTACTDILGEDNTPAAAVEATACPAQPAPITTPAAQFWANDEFGDLKDWLSDEE